MQRWRRTASVTSLALVLAGLVVLAYQYDGKPFTEVELNDGSVWVTNQQMGLTARLNPQIEELDLGVDAGSSSFDIFQRATKLYLDDESSARAVKPVDVARAAVKEPTAIPTGAIVAHGGDTFAVVDVTSGKAWVRPADRLAGFSVKTQKPDVQDALTAAVGTDGRAYVLGRDGQVTPFALDETGQAVADDDVELGRDLEANPELAALTVVGDTPVLFNRSTMELSRPDADPVTLETTDPSAVELQQPSDEAGSVYVATLEGLFVSPLGGGAVERVNRDDIHGRPAAPVVLTGPGCVYAAWADAGRDQPNYLRDCRDGADDDSEPIDGMEDGAQLEFRVNRDVVVLNDVVTGDTWLVQQPGKAKVDNWPQIDPKNQNKSKLKKTTEENPDQENRPPEPEDDDMGARPGRSTVLPVVAYNDHDPDGDIISIEKTTYVSGPELEVKIVGGGTQLQVAVQADDRGTAVFRYYVTDGRVNDRVYATVRIHIREEGQHSKPHPMADRKPVLTVASGASSSYYVLGDFYDPDGDDISLTNARARGGEVEYRPDGTITFTDNGAGAPVTEIEYTLDDGYDVYEGKLDVRVLGSSAPPELVADLASGVADTQVVVQPLTNDRNPEGRDLTLKNVRVIGDDAGTQITRDPESGTFTFLSTKAKSYYLEYTAYNSSATRGSFVRLDIESPAKDNRPPVAVRDKASITPGGTAQVDLLLNDLDPDGDVLVVKRIARSSTPGIKVSVVDKRLAVVSSATDIVGQPATVDYVVSDGRSSTTGQLVIAQRQTNEANRHPVANKDQVTVRAGSVTTVPVLANDSDPDGGKPRLFQSDLENQEDDLDVWVSGDALRLRAPKRPGSYSVIYGVRDGDGLKATAELSIFVIPDSAKNNHPPLPQPIIDRVIGGRPKVISVDLVGADPDGDAVAFRSIATAPSLGRILDTGVDWIRYEAFEGKRGTDFFQIVVQDKYGKTGVAEVRVGVVPEETENQPPVALDDNVLVQPNRTISYDVLTNDVDPDDDPLRIAQLSSTTDVDHKNGFIEVPIGDAPDNGAAATNIGYTIEDVAGAQDNAILKVSASHDAPFYAPIARDDVAELGDIIGRDPGESVEVKVLDNDLDFDGAKADLHITECDTGGKTSCDVVDDDTRVRVELAAHDQVVLYTLDDADEESAPTFGVIFVTGTDNVPPQLTTDADKIPVPVTAGKSVVFDLADLVVTRAGRKPHIVPDELPTAVYGRVEPVEGEPTSLSFTPTRGRVGAASVTVRVSDGRTAAEDAALDSLLTIPIDIEPATNVAPTMRDAAVDVTADGDGATVDLAGLTRDANKDDLASMTYSVVSAPAGIDAKVAPDSSILEVDASGADVGDVLSIKVGADDGHDGTATAVVTARIVGSDVPLLQVPVINVTGDEGEKMSVDVADYAVNRYPDKVIEVSNPRIEGDGRVSDLETKGSSVSFTPTGSGTSTIKVTVSDASGDRKRDVPARINVTVVSEPEAPEKPILSSVEASSAVLSWREPDANGAPIERYEVKGSHGFSQICTGPTCRLDDLTPGEAYTFEVRAENSVGWSDYGPPSEEIIPNKAPDLMSPPTIVVESKPTASRMDRQLTLRWTPPHNEGSEITEYEIKEAGSAHTWSASGNVTSMVIPGLNNGTSYAFEIRAVNDVEPRREFSGPSKAVAPFGVPMRSGAAPQLTASEADNYLQKPWIRIDWSRWTESQSNGNAVSGYTIYCSGCGRSSYQVDGSTSSKLFDDNDGIRKGQTFTFSIAATNDAGTSDRSLGVSGRPYTKAGPVRGLTEVGESPSDSVARIGWDPPEDNGGLPIDHYVVQANTGEWRTVGSAPGAGGTPIDFDSNGTHSIQVWAVTSNNGRTVDGDTSYLGGIETWGRPDPPSASSSSGSPYWVDFRVYAGKENGKSVTGVQWSTDRTNWSDHYSGATNRIDVPEGGSTAGLWVRTVSTADGERRFSEDIQVSGTSQDKSFTITFEKLGGCRRPDDTCLIRVRGSGFVQQDQPANASLAGLSPSGSCDPLDRSVNGSFDYYLGGTGCRFAGTGSVTVTTSGVSASASR